MHMHNTPRPSNAERIRLDKWLWAARFYKTRAMAAQAVDRGHVQVNSQDAKPAREVHVGDTVALRQGTCPLPRVVVVRALGVSRGPASAAQQLYAETEQSLAAREAWATQRRHAADPAQAIEQGRPTKRDRRALAQWNRWSASLDDETQNR
jgi:ribosome-associated heat shock protein Hsp15